MSMMVFEVVGVTRTTGTTLEHQIVGWLTVIGSDRRQYSYTAGGHFLCPGPWAIMAQACSVTCAFAGAYRRIP